MTTENDDYIYDEASGEWRPASEIKAAATQEAEVRDASGTVLADGDSVVLIKDLKIKGAGQTLKQGTVIRYRQRQAFKPLQLLAAYPKSAAPSRLDVVIRIARHVMHKLEFFRPLSA